MKLSLLLALALTCAIATALPKPEQSSEEEFHSAQEEIFHSAEGEGEDGSFHSAEQGAEEIFHSAEEYPEGKANQTVTARGKTLLPSLIALRERITASPPISSN